MTIEKKQKVIKITALMLAVISIISVVIASIYFLTKKNMPKTDNVLSEETDFDETQTYAMPQAMSFSAESLVAAQAVGQTVDVKIKATIIPYDAANQLVDYSIAWGSAPTHGKEAVTDYVTVTQDSDGSLNATISCKKAFGSDKIIVMVTTRDGGHTATCTVSFVGVASTMSVTNDSITPISDSKRGVYYQFGTNKTYTFNVNLDNIFSTVGSKNLVVELGGSGELYFGKTFSDAMSGMSYFSEMTKRKMADMADKFITSATISENTLTVTTGNKLVEEYYSSSEPDEYYTGTYTYDRYVYYDEYDLGLVGGASASDDYTGNSEYNRNALSSCYFTVTVKDTVSGLSETFKIWLVSSVERVTLSKSEVTI